MTLYFLTGNQHKIDEARKIIQNIEPLKIELPEIQGSGEEIIRAKAAEAKKHNIDEFIIEDVGLHLACLNGFPGPLIKWMLKDLKTQGIYDLVRRYENHDAYARCLVGYVKGDKTMFFEGIVRGKIVAPRGTSNFGTFGFDPIFQPDGYTMTYAEMGDAKNAISHRRKALDALKSFL